MLIRIDEADARPIFVQLAEAVRSEILRGRVVVGETLPAARRLADALGINVHTVLRAYQQLRDEGIVDLKRSRGAVVTAHAQLLHDLRADIDALAARADALGVKRETLAAMMLLTSQHDNPGATPAGAVDASTEKGSES